MIPAGTFYCILSSLFVYVNYRSEHKLVLEQRKFKHFFLHEYLYNYIFNLHLIIYIQTTEYYSGVVDYSGLLLILKRAAPITK